MEPNSNKAILRPLIKKLAHPLEEIRNRAFESIQSKLLHGLLCTADLVQEKELLSLLLKWFNFTSDTYKEQCLELLVDLSKHPDAAMNLYSIGGVDFLCSLKTDLAPSLHHHADDIIEAMLRLPETGLNPARVCQYERTEEITKRPTRETSPSVPSGKGIGTRNVSGSAPAATFRSTLGETTAEDTNMFNSRMATAGGEVSEINTMHSGAYTMHSGLSESRVEDDYFLSRVDSTRQSFGGESTLGYFEPASFDGFSFDCHQRAFKFVCFPWLMLTPTDRHVIESTHQSLLSGARESILSACEFLTDVMLHDFPAEIFLQRPSIVKSLLRLLSSPITSADLELKSSIVSTLFQLTKCVAARVRFHQDPAFRSPKQDSFPQPTPSTLSESLSNTSGDSVASSLNSSDSRPSVIGHSGPKAADGRSILKTPAQVAAAAGTTDSSPVSPLKIPISPHLTPIIAGAASSSGNSKRGHGNKSAGNGNHGNNNGSDSNGGNGNDGTNCSGHPNNLGYNQGVRAEDEEEYGEERDTESIRMLQLTVPQFCCLLLRDSTLVLDRCPLDLALLVVRVLREAAGLTQLCVRTSLWECREDLIAKDAVNSLCSSLQSLARLAILYGEPTSVTLKEMATEDKVFISLVLSLQTLSTVGDLFPPEQIGVILTGKVLQLFTQLLFDGAVATSFPAAATLVQDVMRAGDDGKMRTFERAVTVSESMIHTCSFLQRSAQDLFKDETEVLEVVRLAELSLLSLPYHLHMGVVSGYIHVCCVSLSKPLLSDESSVRARAVLLKLLSHGVRSVREEAYKACFNTVRKGLALDKVTQVTSKSLNFLINSEVVREISVFGLLDESPEVRQCSDDLLSYLLQCRLLVTESLWESVIAEVLPSLPILQGYVSTETVLGECILGMVKDSQSQASSGSRDQGVLSEAERMRGLLRVMCSRDAKCRGIATGCLFELMVSDSRSREKAPALLPSDVGRYQDVLVNTNSRHRYDDNPTPVPLSGDNLVKLYNVFTSKKVEVAIRRSAVEQLSIMLHDPGLHATFMDRGGLDEIMFFLFLGVQESDNRPMRDAELETLVPACVTILACLVQHSPSLRATLLRETDLLDTLLRTLILYPLESKTASDVAHILTYLLFHELSVQTDPAEGSGRPQFSLPKCVTIKYKLPLHTLCHLTLSPYQQEIPSPNDPLRGGGVPEGFLRTHWALAQCGGDPEQVLSPSVAKYGHQQSEHSPTLCMTPRDLAMLRASQLSAGVRRETDAVLGATSHRGVLLAVRRLHVLLCLSYVHRGEDVAEGWRGIDITTVLHRFLSLAPKTSADEQLLSEITDLLIDIVTLTSAPSCDLNSNQSGSPSKSHGQRSSQSHTHERSHLKDVSQSVDVLSLVYQYFYDPSSALLGIAGEGESNCRSWKRSLQNNLLELIRKLGAYEDESRALGKGQIVYALLQRLTRAIADSFYNLSLLEGTVDALVYCTARPGWSLGSPDLDSRTLCYKLLQSLLDVLSAFHTGRQRLSLSYMGKGVIRGSTVCLGQLTRELEGTLREKDWLKQWVSHHQIPGKSIGEELAWLMPLWAYRDPEVRAAAIGVAVSLCSTDTGLNSFESFPALWDVALAVLLDSMECSLVRKQASDLLTTLGVKSVKRLQHQDKDTRDQVVKALVSSLENNKFFEEMVQMVGESVFLSEPSLPCLYPSLRAPRHSVNSFSSNGSLTSQSVRVDAAPALSGGRTVVTPCLVTSVCRLMTSLTILCPQLTAHLLLKHQVQSAVLRIIDVDRLISLCGMSQCSSTVYILREDSLDLHRSLIGLLRAMGAASRPIRAALLQDGSAMGAVVKLYQLKGSGGRYAVTIRAVWREVSLLLSMLLRTEGRTALKSIATVLSSYWSGLCGVAQICFTTDDKRDNPSALALCEFLLLLWAEEGGRIKKDRVSSGSSSHSIQSILERKEGDTDVPYGEVLCLVLLPLYDSLLMRYMAGPTPHLAPPSPRDNEGVNGETERDEDYSSTDRLRALVLPTFSSLLGISLSAKSAALDAGLCESVVEHMKHVIDKLGLTSIQFNKPVKKQMSWLMKELGSSLTLLSSLMYRWEAGKEAACSCGLASVIHRLWAWAEVETSLMAITLQTLICFTAQSSIASRSLVCTSPLTYDSREFTVTSGSLAQSVVRYTGQQVVRLKPDVPLVRTLMGLLGNFALSPECLSVLWKSGIMARFSELKPQRHTEGRKSTAVEEMWLDLFVNISFSSDGHQMIFRTQDSVDILIEYANLDLMQLQERALIILHNLSVGQGGKMKLLSNDKLISMLMACLERESGRGRYAASAVLQSLLISCNKSKVMLKTAGAEGRLSELLDSWSSQRRMSDQKTIQNREVKEYTRTLKGVLHTLRTTS